MQFVWCGGGCFCLDVVVVVGRYGVGLVERCETGEGNCNRFYSFVLLQCVPQQAVSVSDCFRRTEYKRSQSSSPA